MQVELEHNPYRGSLRILVNGQARPRFAKYSYKPFSVWYKDILNLLDGEANEPYSLELTASDAESKIIKSLSSATKYCKNISMKPFSANMSTENRIMLLEKSCANLRTVPINICIMPSLQGSISLLDVKNVLRERKYTNNLWQICSGSVSADSLSENNNSAEYLFIIAGSEKEFSNALLSSAKMGFYSEICVLILDEKENTFLNGNYLIVHGNILRWQEELKKLLNCIVIGDCFSITYNNISENLKNNSAFEIKERPKVFLPDFIEQEEKEVVVASTSNGRHSEIEIFSRNNDIIRIEGNVLVGAKEGTTNIQVFEAGTNQLLVSKDIRVRYIPRVRELYARDVALRHGEPFCINEKKTAVIQYSYAPKGSENISDIRWSSDNSGVVRVHSLSGRITAMHAGECNVSCYIGDIGFSVRVVVLPAPEKIELSDIYGREIALNNGEYFQLNYSVIPSNANYGNIEVVSRNPEVVRVIDNNKIQAVSEGLTEIVISEDLFDTMTTIDVRVFEVKKRGLISKIFKK